MRRGPGRPPENRSLVDERAAPCPQRSGSRGATAGPRWRPSSPAGRPLRRRCSRGSWRRWKIRIHWLSSRPAGRSAKPRTRGPWGPWAGLGEPSRSPMPRVRGRRSRGHRGPGRAGRGTRPPRRPAGHPPSGGGGPGRLQRSRGRRRAESVPKRFRDWQVRVVAEELVGITKPKRGRGPGYPPGQLPTPSARPIGPRRPGPRRPRPRRP